MPASLDTVYIYIYIVRFNGIEEVNIEKIKEAMYFRRI